MESPVPLALYQGSAAPCLPGHLTPYRYTQEVQSGSVITERLHIDVKQDLKKKKKKKKKKKARSSTPGQLTPYRYTQEVQ